MSPVTAKAAAKLSKMSKVGFLIPRSMPLTYVRSIFAAKARASCALYRRPRPHGKPPLGLSLQDGKRVGHRTRKPEADFRHEARAVFRLLQRQGNDLIPHSIGDAVPDPRRGRGPVLQPLGSMFDEAVIPPVKRGGWDADLGQGSSDGQMRLLHQPDDLKLLRGRVPHS